jgi:hypothetical protein
MSRLLIGSIVLVLSACAGGPGQADLSNPEAVAKGFFNEVRDRHPEGAAYFVHPSQREACMEIVGAEDPPEIPRSIDVEVLIQGDSGTARITGSSIGVDLVRENGRWFVLI